MNLESDTSITSDPASRTSRAYRKERPYIVRCVNTPPPPRVSVTGEMTSRHHVTDTRRRGDKWSQTTHAYFLTGAPRGSDAGRAVAAVSPETNGEAADTYRRRSTGRATGRRRWEKFMRAAICWSSTPRDGAI